MEYHNPFEGRRFDDAYSEQLRRLSAGIDMLIISSDTAAVVTVTEDRTSVEWPNRSTADDTASAADQAQLRTSEAIVTKDAAATVSTLAKTATMLNFAKWAAEQERFGVEPDMTGIPARLDYESAVASSAWTMLPDSRKLIASKTLIRNMGTFETIEKHSVQLDDGLLCNVLDVTLIDGQAIFADTHLKPSQNAFYRKLESIVGTDFMPRYSHVLTGRYEDVDLILSLRDVGLRLIHLYPDREVGEFLQQFRERAESAKRSLELRPDIHEGIPAASDIEAFQRALALAA